MNISLTQELEQLVNEKVRSGRYKSASEVVREALRLLEERDQIRALRKEELRNSIARGLADLDAGRSGVFDEELLAEVKRSGRRRRNTPT